MKNMIIVNEALLCSFFTYKKLIIVMLALHRCQTIEDIILVN